MHHPCNYRSAMTVVELLVGLVISALLLAATCTALLAATNSARSNDSHARARQSANNALNYILTKARRAKEISFQPANPPYTTIITLDQGTWDDALKDYDPATCIWTQITVSGDKLRIGSGNSTSPGMTDVLSDLQGMAITAKPDHYGTFHEITVQLTITPPDTFSGRKVDSFAVSGTTMCRSEGPTTAPAN